MKIINLIAIGIFLLLTFSCNGVKIVKDDSLQSEDYLKTRTGYVDSLQ